MLLWKKKEGMKEKEVGDEEMNTMILEFVDQMEIEISEIKEETSEGEGVGDN